MGRPLAADLRYRGIPLPLICPFYGAFQRDITPDTVCMCSALTQMRAIIGSNLGMYPLFRGFH